MIRQRKPMKRGKPLRRESKKHAAKRKRPPVPAREPITWPIVLHEPQEPVHSTTARSEGVPLPKDGRFDCAALRGWVRRQQCVACQGKATDAHHEPTRGSGGDDLGMVPLCRGCHDARHRGEIDAAFLLEKTADVLRRFIVGATEEERLAFFRSWQDFAEARVWTVPA